MSTFESKPPGQRPRKLVLRKIPNHPSLPLVRPPPYRPSYADIPPEQPYPSPGLSADAGHDWPPAPPPAGSLPPVAATVPPAALSAHPEHATLRARFFGPPMVVACVVAVMGALLAVAGSLLVGTRPEPVAAVAGAALPPRRQAPMTTATRPAPPVPTIAPADIAASSLPISPAPRPPAARAASFVHTVAPVAVVAAPRPPAPPAESATAAAARVTAMPPSVAPPEDPFVKAVEDDIREEREEQKHTR